MRWGCWPERLPPFITLLAPLSWEGALLLNPGVKLLGGCLKSISLLTRDDREVGRLRFPLTPITDFTPFGWEWFAVDMKLDSAMSPLPSKSGLLFQILLLLLLLLLAWRPFDLKFSPLLLTKGLSSPEIEAESEVNPWWWWEWWGCSDDSCLPPNSLWAPVTPFALTLGRPKRR